MINGSPGIAESYPYTQLHDIAIPALDAAEALNRLAEQTGAVLLFPYDLVKSKRANAVNGRYTLPQALARLLEGSGLSSGLSDKRVIQISLDQGSERSNPEGTMTTTPVDESFDEPADGRSPHGSHHGEAGLPLRKKVVAFLASFLALTGASAQEDRDAKTQEITEIVVTAQKRGDQSLQKVPISISVLGGAQLDQGRFPGTTEALATVPGVSAFKHSQGGGTKLSMRGVTSASPLFAGSSAVAYYLDDVPFGLVKTAALPDSSVYDLARIEALRGPQGTLYGASALNGVVRVLTREPDFNEVQFKALTAYATTEGGGPSYRADMALNLPLVPGKLAARAVAGYNKLGGWIDKVHPSAPITVIDDESNRGDISNFRLKVSARPTEAFSIDFTSWVSRSDYDAPPVSGANTIHISPFNEPITVDYETYGLTLGYDFSSFALRSSTSYVNYENGSTIFISNTAGGDLFTGLKSRVFTEEITLTSRLAGPWQWTAGFFYRDGSDPLFQTLPAFLPAPLSWTDESRSYAVYGEVIRTLFGGAADLTLGLRYFEDDVSIQERIGNTGNPNQPLVNVSNTFDNVSPRVVLSWYPTDSTTFYGSYSQGFRSGFDQTPVALTVAPNAPPVHEDTLDNYEIGAKGSAFGRRLRFEAALFYIDWQDTIQTVGIAVPDGQGNFVNITVPVNGQSASGFGADLGLTVAPTDRLTLGLALSWNDLTMDGDVVASSGTALFKRGDRLAESPEYTAGISGDYTFPLSPRLNGRIAASANYHSELVSRRVQGSVLQKGIGDQILVANLSLSAEAAERWTATLYADNLNDEQGAPRANQNIPNVNSRIRPRTVGVQLEYRF